MTDEMTVGGKTYKTSIFWIQAQASYAKALVFLAEATVAQQNKNYIWASVSLYYSLFHLSLALVFICPHRVKPSLFEKLLERRRGGAADPTRVIRHGDIPEFLRGCEVDSLTPELRNSFERAQELRKFVNYGPRIVWRKKQAFFLACEHEPLELDGLLDGLEAVFGQVIDWASKRAAPAGDLGIIASATAKDFLTRSDLLYPKWCSPAVMEHARRVAKDLCKVSGVWEDV